MPPVVHPGRVLKRELAARKLSADRLALDLGVPSGRITDILNGRRAITADTAVRLGRYFGNRAQFWLDLQSQFDIAVVERERGGEIAKRVRPALPAIVAEMRSPMSDPRHTGTIPDELRGRANDVLDRLFALDEAVANARAFRAILEDLHRRNLSAVREPHVSSIVIVRAGILRAAFGAIMACLDPSDRRGNRASVGQILDKLQEPALAAVFPDHARAAADAAEALASVRAEFKALQQDKLFQDGRTLRNNAIAHILIPDEPTPTVKDDAFYKLHDAAEKLVIGLYVACARGRPKFVAHEERFTRLAATFWDTYFTGMSGANT